MRNKLILAFLTYCVVGSVLAAEQIVKEETTPPPAEGALTIDQLPPILLSRSN